MPLSDINGARLPEQDRRGARARRWARGSTYFWRPYLERGITRQTFDTNDCDVLLDLPAVYEPALTTFPIYRTTYVLAYRNDRGLDIKDLDDPTLKKLKIGVFQTSGLREVLTRARAFGEPQPAHAEPQRRPDAREPALAPGAAGHRRQARRCRRVGTVRRLAQDDEGRSRSPSCPSTCGRTYVPLEFDLAPACAAPMRVLKYMLEFALEATKGEIEKILTDYGVPLVAVQPLPRAGRPAVARHLHQAGIRRLQVEARGGEPDQLVTQKRLETWLEEGADLKQELSNAVLAADSGPHQVPRQGQGRRHQRARRARLCAAAYRRPQPPSRPDRGAGRSRRRSQSAGQRRHDAAAARRHAQPRADHQDAAGARGRHREEGSAGLPGSGARHRRAEVRGGEGAARGGRRHQHGGRAGRPHAADDRRQPGLSGRGRDLPARQHPAHRYCARR